MEVHKGELYLPVFTLMIRVRLGLLIDHPLQQQQKFNKGGI